MFGNARQVNVRVHDREFVPGFPICLCSLSLTAKNVFATRRGCELIAGGYNHERSGGTLKVFECDALLADEFLTDEFSRNLQADLRLARQCLGPPQSGVRWTYRTSSR